MLCPQHEQFWELGYFQGSLDLTWEIAGHLSFSLELGAISLAQQANL